MEQLSEPSMNQCVPGQPGAARVNGRGAGGGGRCGLCGTASSCYMWCSQEALLCRARHFPPPCSPLGPRFTPSEQGRRCCQEDTEKQAATCTITPAHAQEDRHRRRPRRRGDAHTHIHTHCQKVSKGLSYLISIVIGLSSGDNPLV